MIKKLTKTILLSTLALSLTMASAIQQGVMAAEPGITNGSELQFTKIEKERVNASSDMFDHALLGKVRDPEAVYFSTSTIDYKGEDVVSFNFSNHTKGNVFVYIQSKENFHNITAPKSTVDEFIANSTKKDLPKVYKNKENKAHFISFKLDTQTYNEKLYRTGFYLPKSQESHDINIYMEFDRDYPTSAKTVEDLEAYLEKNAKKYTLKAKEDGESLRFHTWIEKDKANTYNGGEEMKIATVNKTEEKQSVDKNVIFYAVAGIAVVAGLITGLAIRNKKRK